MKAPKDHWIIQIEVTNACVHKCSNCTRFCGHHKKPFFMDYDTFCKAVDASIDHPGLLGVMGGEPTLHPQFEEMCKYLYQKIPEEKRVKPGILKLPTDSFIEVRRKFELDEYEIHEYADGPRPIIQGAGLWTSMTNKYLQNFEIIQDVFNFQNLNDHTNVSYHQPVLISRKDMGIDDKTWIKLREKCWINQQWSSSITPKGCFFCEVAAAMDMLYDGPGGLPIEKGWWKRDINDFKEQFRWCELCGIPLKTFARDAREEIDDVADENYKLMREKETVRFDSSTINYVEINNGKISEESKKSASDYHGVSYIENAQERVSERTPIYAEHFTGILVCESEEELKKYGTQIDVNMKYLDKLYVVVSGILKEEIYSNGRVAEVNEDTNWNKIFHKDKLCTYYICFTPEIELCTGFDKLKSCVVNPGTLHYIDFSQHKENNVNEYVKCSDSNNFGICMLLNNKAMCVNGIPENLKIMKKSFLVIKKIWMKEKIIELTNTMNKMMLNVSNENNLKQTKKRRMLDGLYFMRKCIREYGIFKTIDYGFTLTKKYGIKLTINKLKSRIF